MSKFIIEAKIRNKRLSVKRRVLHTQKVAHRPALKLA